MLRILSCVLTLQNSARAQIALIAASVLTFQVTTAAAQASIDKYAAIWEWSKTLTDITKLIDSAGDAVAGQPSSFQKELEEVDALALQLDRAVPPAAPALSTVSFDSVTSKDTAIRSRALASLHDDAAKLDTHEQELRNQAQSYLQLGERARTASKAAHEANRKLESMLNNPMLSGLDSVFGQQLLNAWLATGMLSNKLSGIGSSADFLNRNFINRADIVKTRSAALRAGIRGIERLNTALAAPSNSPDTKPPRTSSFIELRTKPSTFTENRVTGSGTNTALLVGYKTADGKRIYQQVVQFTQTGNNSWLHDTGLDALLTPVDVWAGSTVSVFEVPESEARKAAWVIGQFKPPATRVDRLSVIRALVDVTGAASLSPPANRDVSIKNAVEELRSKNSNETIAANKATKDADAAQVRTGIRANPAPPTRNHLPGAADPGPRSPEPMPTPIRPKNPTPCGFSSDGLWTGVPCP